MAGEGGDRLPPGARRGGRLLTADPRGSASGEGPYGPARQDDYEPLADPLEEFQRVFAAARRAVAPPDDATAMVLSTADAEGRPSARVVLLKGVEDGGFVFYTNYASRKAEQLAANPWAALTFHWPVLGWQVRAEGRVEKVDAATSDAYFDSRPRGSRVGAWASLQSRPLASREVLVERVEAMEERFADGRVPRPDGWGGFRLTPQRMEHWRDRAYRLHDRWVYLRDGDAWRRERQYP